MTKEPTTLADALAVLRAHHFVALILDNEVTVGAFLADPPLPWVRLVQRDGVFQVADGYPTELTAAQAQREMRNWDDVSLPAIVGALRALSEQVDYVLFGNNAGQGLPLAQALPPRLLPDRAAIIYADRLPHLSAYQAIGYRRFAPRRAAVAGLLGLAEQAGRPLALCFVNTIQHNDSNYHDP
jgi:hypothetical protein